MNRKLKGRIVEKFGTQFEFSKAVNEHECNVSRVIRGRRTLSKRERKTWAEALGEGITEALFSTEEYNG